MLGITKRTSKGTSEMLGKNLKALGMENVKSIKELYKGLGFPVTSPKCKRWIDHHTIETDPTDRLVLMVEEKKTPQGIKKPVWMAEIYSAAGEFRGRYGVMSGVRVDHEYLLETFEGRRKTLREDFFAEREQMKDIQEI